MQPSNHTTGYDTDLFVVIKNNNAYDVCEKCSWLKNKWKYLNSSYLHVKSVSPKHISKQSRLDVAAAVRLTWPFNL